MGTTDTTTDSLLAHRVARFEELGFSVEAALTLLEAKKSVSNQEGNRVFWYDVPVTWHDAIKLLNAGATHDQVVRILGS